MEHLGADLEEGTIPNRDGAIGGALREPGYAFICADAVKGNALGLVEAGSCQEGEDVL